MTISKNNVQKPVRVQVQTSVSISFLILSYIVSAHKNVFLHAIPKWLLGTAKIKRNMTYSVMHFIKWIKSVYSIVFF